MKGKKGTDAHDHGTQDFVADVKVIMSKADALWRQDPVIGIPGGKKH